MGILLAGCGTVDLEIRQGYSNPSMQPRSVAILPFTLEEPDPEGVSPHELFRNSFYNYFSYLGYTDLPLETVDKKLAQAGLTDSPKILAEFCLSITSPVAFMRKLLSKQKLTCLT
jgi:hypothetical protein